MATKKSTENYEALRAELDAILMELQREDLDVDTAVKQYERGLELVRLLEASLKTAENKVRELKATFSADSK